MVKRKSKVDWERARTLWEADPKLSMAGLARLINVSKEAVSKRAKAEGWVKVSENEAAAKVVRQKAEVRADQRTADLAETTPPVGDGTAPDEHPDAPQTPLQASVDTAVEARAKIIERHRREWDGARNRVYKALQGNDFDQAKLGKITAEALKIIQDGERKAWGLDAEPEKKVTVLYGDGKEGSW